MSADVTELSIEGMTCASCAARIEKKLNRLDGVTASVNYATARAHVEHPDSVAVAELIDTVTAIGYAAATEPAQRRELPVPARLVTSAALTVPVLVLSMVPAAQFPGWQWVVLLLASPVVLWGALPFHRAAWTNLRHGAATMDTLISVGVLAAYVWSLWALVFGDAGEIGMRMTFSFTATAGDEIYLEVAAAVTVFLLAGRYVGGPGQAALGRSAARAARTRREGRRRAARRRRAAGADRFARGRRPFVVRPGEKIATDGVVVDGRVRSGRHRWSPASRSPSRWARRRGRRRDRQRRRPAGRAGHPGRRGHAARPARPGW